MILGERIMRLLKCLSKVLLLIAVFFTVVNAAWSQTPNIEEGVEFRLFALDLLTPRGMARVSANQLVFDTLGVPLQSGEQLSLIISDPVSGELLSYDALVGPNVRDLLVNIPGAGYVSLKDTLLQQNVRLALPTGTPQY